MSQYKWYRRLCGGVWRFVVVSRPYDFTHMSYWIRREPVAYNEVVIKTEVWR
jgi:hypothetical protein